MDTAARVTSVSGRAGSAGTAHRLIAHDLLSSSPEIARLHIPTYQNRPSSPTNLTLHQALDINVPIGCGDIAVWPGHIMVGDDEAVVVIPAAIADDIGSEAVEMTVFEDFVTEQVREGRSVIGLYPATHPKTLADFTSWRAKRER